MIVMSEQIPISDEVLNGKRKNANGSYAHAPNGGSGVPGFDLRTLYAERNWTALGGLLLFALGALWAIQHVLGLHLELWAVALGGIGFWLVLQSWTTVNGDLKRLDEPARNRLIVGASMVAIGVLSMIDINWWSLLLIGAGGWLGYTTWQKYEAAGRTWTRGRRDRLFVAAGLVILGLSSFISSGSAWLLLIIVGAAMLYRWVGQRRCC
jgi:hypothetical protein